MELAKGGRAVNEVEIIQHPQIDGLHLFFNQVDYRAPHVHAEWELIWVMEGQLSLACGQRPHGVSAGQMALVGPNQLHEFHKVGESCTFLCMQVGPRCFEQSFPALERIQVTDVYPHKYLAPGAYRQVQQALLACMRVYLERPDCYELFCLGQASLLLYRLLTAMPVRVITAQEAAEREKRNARLARLLDFVEQNYMHKIRLSDFARAENRSMSYLSHFVKETLNQSFQDYVNTVRFNAACGLIASGEQKMLDVCMEAGFSDYRYFSKTFQKKLGMTPEAYSRQRRSPVLEEASMRHSLHSTERFYSREKSLELLAGFEGQYC